MRVRRGTSPPYLGWRVWAGGELWLDPEVDQGFGLSNTLGAAGFPSGEAYKVGAAEPYVRVQRVMFRQTWNLGGGKDDAEADLNQFAQSRTANRVTLTLGKFSVGDVFDANQYAHDPRADFLNWTAIDAGTFDYAADAWGYFRRRGAGMAPGPLHRPPGRLPSVQRSEQHQDRYAIQAVRGDFRSGGAPHPLRSAGQGDAERLREPRPHGSARGRDRAGAGDGRTRRCLPSCGATPAGRA